MMRVVGMGVVALDVVRYDGMELQRAGGSSVNVLLHLADMGWDCTMCHMDGHDEISQYLKDDLADGGVKSISLSHDVPSYVSIINSKNGTHTFQRTCEHGVNITSCKVVVPELEERLDPDYDVFVFDRAWDAAARFARRSTGMAWFETFRHKVGDNTWDECARMSNVVKAADDIGIPDGVNGIVTRGADGLAYWWNGVSGWLDSVAPPKIVDACGCGDCVSACCIDAACRGEPVETGLARGMRLAALNCCYPGPRCMLDSTTQEYRKGVMDGNPIRNVPKAVYKGANFDICRCDKP